jgi:dimethylglycine dehydrogenase
MKTHARVAVIGGGVVGCSVLYHLTKLGWRDVVLLERDELTCGSTWHAAGGMHTLNGDPNVARLQKYTIELYKEIEQISGQSCGLHLPGGLVLAGTPERIDWLKMAAARGRYLGLHAELVDMDEAVRRMPLIDKRHFIGALFDPLEGHCDPSGTTHAYARAATAQGAEIYRKTKVEALHPRSDGGWSVVTEQGTLIAEHVVNCGGLWAREVCRMVGIELPVLAMEHQYLITEDVPHLLPQNGELPHCIDFEGEIYLRQERQGVLLGTYERDGVPWSPKTTPWNFSAELLPPDLDRIAHNLEVGFQHFPALAEAGIRRVINGPFTFSPDGNPLVGPVRGLRNFWVACGVMAGFSQGGGVGLALAGWMIDGDPGFDVWAMDVARFGDWAGRAYTNAKVRENYGRRFRVTFPNEELPAARPLRTSPLYETMQAAGAVFGAAFGLEQPLWFAPKGTVPVEEVTFRRSNAHGPVGEECRAVRTGVGLIETSGYAKYEVAGAQAEAFLNRVLAGRMPPAGRIVLTPMLNAQGKLIGDFTVARLSPDVFHVFGSGPAEQYHMRWWESHAPATGVAIRSLRSALMGLSIAGPAARAVLGRVTDEDVSADAFPFLSYRRMDIGMVPAFVGRLSFTGDLGYEFWVAPDWHRALYETLMAAGAEFGLRKFGLRALNALRLEKSFGTWAREFRPIYGPAEAGLGRFVAFKKPDFIGRDAALREREAGGKLRLVTLTVEEFGADALGDEPVSYDGRTVGWVTSGGYAHTSSKSVALAYVPAELAASCDPFTVEILGAPRTAHIAREPLFDPAGTRMRA